MSSHATTTSAISDGSQCFTLQKLGIHSLRSSQNEGPGGGGPGGGPGGDGDGLHEESLHDVHAQELAKEPDTHWSLLHGFVGFPTVQQALSSQHQHAIFCAIQLSQVSIAPKSISFESACIEADASVSADGAVFEATASAKGTSPVASRALAVGARQPPPPPPLAATQIG